MSNDNRETDRLALSCIMKTNAYTMQIVENEGGQWTLSKTFMFSILLAALVNVYMYNRKPARPLGMTSSFSQTPINLCATMENWKTLDYSYLD